MTKPSHHELSPVFISNSVMEAEEVRCLLEGSGLTPIVFDEHLPRMIPALGGSLGGVRVMVPHDQLELAAEVLRDAGRLEAESLPATGRSPHPYAAVARGRRSLAIALLAVAALGALAAAGSVLLRAFNP